MEELRQQEEEEEKRRAAERRREEKRLEREVTRLLYLLINIIEHSERYESEKKHFN